MQVFCYVDLRNSSPAAVIYTLKVQVHPELSYALFDETKRASQPNWVFSKRNTTIHNFWVSGNISTIISTWVQGYTNGCHLKSSRDKAIEGNPKENH